MGCLKMEDAPKSRVEEGKYDLHTENKLYNATSNRHVSCLKASKLLKAYQNPVLFREKKKDTSSAGLAIPLFLHQSQGALHCRAAQLRQCRQLPAEVAPEDVVQHLEVCFGGIFSGHKIWYCTSQVWG